MKWPLVKEEPSKGAQGQRRAGIGTMIVGGVFLGLGVIATIVSYSLASGGGTYFVFYGAMIFGALDLVVGWVRYLSAPKEGVLEDAATSVAGSQAFSAAGGPGAVRGPERPSAIDSALFPSATAVSPGAVATASVSAGPITENLGSVPVSPPAVVVSQPDVPAQCPRAVAQSEGPTPSVWSASPGVGEGRDRLYFDEAAVARLREQTRVYYAQQSMRAQGRCEICGQALTRAARWRGEVRCHHHR